jgi:AcrR family transcriptional regulator
MTTLDSDASRLQLPRATTARGQRTRERLLDAAERLWGERGVDAVSLREIRLEAGQRNSSALQFHFGDRDGLQLALSQRHLPRISAEQERLYGDLVAAGRHEDLAGLVEVMVRPGAEYVRRGPSERAWTKIVAQQVSRPELELAVVAEHVPELTYRIGAALHQQVTRVVSPELALERMMSVFIACAHLSADRARQEDLPSGAAGRAMLPFDRWLSNLLDMAVAAMTAPPR